MNFQNNIRHEIETSFPIFFSGGKKLRIYCTVCQMTDGAPNFATSSTEKTTLLNISESNWGEYVASCLRKF